MPIMLVPSYHLQSSQEVALNEPIRAPVQPDIVDESHLTPEPEKMGEKVGLMVLGKLFLRLAGYPLMILSWYGVYMLILKSMDVTGCQQI